MAENIVARILLRDELSRPMRRAKKEVQDFGDETEETSKKTEGFDENLKNTTKSSHTLTDELGRLNTQIRGLGHILKALKIPLYLGLFKLAAGAVNALSAGVVALVGNISKMSGVLGALPAGIFALVSTMATIKLAVSGIGDAVKVLSDPTAKAEEVAEALKGLSQPAREFAQTLADMKPLSDRLRASAAEGLLPGLNRGLRELATLAPLAGSVLKGTGRVLGQVAEDGARMVASGPFAADFQLIAARNNVLLDKVGHALLNIVDALRHVMVAAGPMVNMLSDMALRASEFLQHQAGIGRESGRMEAFFTRSVATMKQWGRIIRDITVGLFHIFKQGTSMGDSLVATLERGSAEFRAWTSSVSGRNSIAEWFAEARPVLTELGDLMRDLVMMFGRVAKDGQSDLAGVIRLIRTEFLPALEALLTGLNEGEMGEGLVKLAAGVSKWMNFASFQPLIDGLNLVAWAVNAVMNATEAHPVFSAMATSVTAAGLALATLGVAAKATGITALMKAFGEKGAITHFTRGLTASEKAATGVSGALGKATRATAKWIAESVKAAAAGVKTAAVWVAGKVAMLAHAVASGIASAATAVWTGIQAAFNFVMSLNPVVLIVLGIVALIAAVVLAYQKVDWFRAGVDALWQAIQKAWDFVLKLAGVLVDLWLNFTPLGQIVKHWDTIWAAIKLAWEWSENLRAKVVDLFLKFTPLGQVITHFETLKGAVEDVVGAIDKLNEKLDRLGPAKYLIPGLGPALGARDLWNGIFGDTSRSRAGGGNLARTAATHAAVDGATPGNRAVSNVTFGQYAGSDHRAGRALDLVGSNLNTYARNLRKMGGFAEMHGSGRGRHLHAAYGDTTRPRAGGMGAGDSDAPIQIMVNVTTNTELDVEAAVVAALRQYERDRRERGRR